MQVPAARAAPNILLRSLAFADATKPALSAPQSQVDLAGSPRPTHRTRHRSHPNHWRRLRAHHAAAGKPAMLLGGDREREDRKRRRRGRVANKVAQKLGRRQPATRRRP